MCDDFQLADPGNLIKEHDRVRDDYKAEAMVAMNANSKAWETLQMPVKQAARDYNGYIYGVVMEASEGLELGQAVGMGPDGRVRPLKVKAAPNQILHPGMAMHAPEFDYSRIYAVIAAIGWIAGVAALFHFLG